MEIIKGTLYITGTPIGNLGDITARALEVLAGVDFIAAEDTRVTLKLLTKFGIRKPLIACRQHNIREVSADIVRRLQNGESCAVVTDAGMPCVSDPGAELIALCREQGVRAEVIPGPSALVAALALSGFESRRFSFEGFLSVNPRQRKERLDIVRDYNGLLIFYEAPHKLLKTLADLQRVLGDRDTILCREMTKIHEQTLSGTLSELSARFSDTTPKGEFVLVIDNRNNNKQSTVTAEEAARIAAGLVGGGEKPADACRTAAKQTGLSKSIIYKELMKEDT